MLLKSMIIYIGETVRKPHSYKCYPPLRASTVLASIYENKNVIMPAACQSYISRL